MSFSLTVLGSSSALPTSKRFPSAHVLNVHERFFLIDCGEGTQIQLRKFKVKMARLNHVFISHLHGDHYFGIFGLISTFCMLGRTNDLYIYAPKNLESILGFQFKFFEDNLPFKINYHTLCETPEVLLDDEQLSIESFPLKHRVPTWGFIFREKRKPFNMLKDAIAKYNIPVRLIAGIKNGADFVTAEGLRIGNDKLTLPSPEPRMYAHCSDTLYNEDIIPFIRNADLLYHEATYMNNFEARAKETFHSTTAQAATIAKKAGVKKLVIGHFSARYKDLDPVLKEAKDVFEHTDLAEDGRTFDIVCGKNDS